MKPTSTKASGLLGDLSFQSVRGSQEQSENTSGSQLIPDDTSGSQNKSVVVKSEQRKSEESPLEKGRKVQQLIEQGKTREALIESGAVKKTFKMPQSNQGIRGAGNRTRMAIAMNVEMRDYIAREARKRGMTQGEYIYALASAAASGMINLEDFLDK